MIKVAHICLHRDQPQLDSRSDAYIEQAQELVINENILLQVTKMYHNLCPAWKRNISNLWYSNIW